MSVMSNGRVLGASLLGELGKRGRRARGRFGGDVLFVLYAYWILGLTEIHPEHGLDGPNVGISKQKRQGGDRGADWVYIRFPSEVK